MTKQRIRLRRDSTADWDSVNPVLSAGEPGYEEDVGKIKVGDGVTAWLSLDYINKGDKGDVGDPGPSDINYETRTAVQAATISGVVDGIKTLGYRAVGDGGGALYKRVVSEPSHEGKIQSNDGAWWEIAETRISPRMFGAYGDWTSGNLRDDTTAFQDAIDYLQTFPGVSDGFPMGYQGHVLFVPGGKYGINNTLDNTNSRGFLSIIGDSQEASIIVWNKTTAGFVPFLDHGAKGENSRFENIRTYVHVGATLPSTWIKTTTFIDHGFSVRGSYFYNAEDSIIECGGCVNANLVNWRCEGTNNTIIKMSSIGGQPRVLQINDFTLHARDATNSAERLTVLDSLFDLTLGSSNTNHFIVKDSSIELDTGAVDLTFDYFVLRGESTRVPAVVTTFENVGCFKQTAEASPAFNFISGLGSGVDFHTVHNFVSTHISDMDTFASGTLHIVDQGILGTSLKNKWLHDVSVSSASSNIISNRGKQSGLRQRTLLTITGISTIDWAVIPDDTVELTAAAIQDLVTISNGVNGAQLFIRANGSSSTITVKHNTGNISLALAADLAINSIKFLHLVYDQQSGMWIQVI